MGHAHPFVAYGAVSICRSEQRREAEERLTEAVAVERAVLDVAHGIHLVGLGAEEVLSILIVAPNVRVVTWGRAGYDGRFSSWQSS